jgi:SAM-dependent methyltransferase
MNMPRSLERFIRFMLDECCPPFLRDSRLFMRLPFRIAFGDKAGCFMDFKARAAEDHDGLLSSIYEETGGVRIQDSGSDLSDALAELVSSEVAGRTVLDAGCGGGHLAGMLSRDHEVTACDISIDKEAVKKYPGVLFRTGDVQALPFADGEFDTVTCAHTLEHIWDVHRAVEELRRVSAKRLIVVVPRERPYRFSFNLHLHFFRFEYQLHQLFAGRDPEVPFRIEMMDGCWYYREDRGTAIGAGP